MENEKTDNILIIEDDIQLTFFVKTVLERDGYQVKTFHNGLDGFQAVSENNYSLILLDVNLPGIDGFSICRKVREVSDIPIIFFTAQNRVHEKVKGLDAGANDYITKPVEVPELLARVRAHLRTKNPGRVNSELSEAKETSAFYPEKSRDEYVFSDLCLDVVSRQVRRENSVIHLPPKEFDILLFFMKNPNKLLTKQQIFEEVWQAKFNKFSDKRVVDEHINKLRNKIHSPDKPKLLHTIYGVGHILK